MEFTKDPVGMGWDCKEKGLYFDSESDRDTAAKMIEAMMWQYANKVAVSEMGGKWIAYWMPKGGGECRHTKDFPNPWDAILAAKEASKCVTRTAQTKK